VDLRLAEIDTTIDPYRSGEKDRRLVPLPDYPDKRGPWRKEHQASRRQIMDKRDELTIDELNFASGGKAPSIGIGYGVGSDCPHSIDWADPSGKGYWKMTEGQQGVTWVPY
jgi:hypothetical protein